MLFKIPSEIQKEIAQKAKNLRKQQKLTQVELAEQAGITLASLKRFEQSGKISLDSLIKIAHRLNDLEAFEQLFNQKKSLPKSLGDILKSNK